MAEAEVFGGGSSSSGSDSSESSSEEEAQQQVYSLYVGCALIGVVFNRGRSRRNPHLLAIVEMREMCGNPWVQKRVGKPANWARMRRSKVNVGLDLVVTHQHCQARRIFLEPTPRMHIPSSRVLVTFFSFL